MDANVAAVICAAIAMIASTIAAFLQYRGAIRQRKNELDDANAKELEKAKKELDDSKRAEADKALRDEIKEMGASLKQSVDSIGKEVSDLQKHVKGLDERMTKLDRTMEKRISTHEERMRAIVEVLSKNARTFSALVRAQRQTDTRLQTIMEVESYNLKFSQETAGALAVVGEMLAEQIEVAGVSDTDMFRLREALKTAKGAQSGFTEKILKAQVSFVSKDPASGQQDITGDKEVASIQAIMHAQNHKPVDDEDDEEDAP